MNAFYKKLVLKLSALVPKELEFLRENLCALNRKGCGFERLDASRVCNFDLLCYASDVGFGGYKDVFSSNDRKCPWDMYMAVELRRKVYIVLHGVN